MDIDREWAPSAEAPRDDRAMATLRAVSDVSPIPGADAVDVATVEGWKAVVRKGEFVAGDPCVYFEIDSFLPASDPRFSFLSAHVTAWRGREGAKLSTRVMRGQLSQGLAMPLALFPEVRRLVAGLPPAEARRVDLSDVLGVVKWEADVPDEIAGAVVGYLPSLLGRTSLERAQNLPTLFRDRGADAFEASVKVDGISAHVFRLGGRVRVAAGKWEIAERAGEPVWAAARDSGLVEGLDEPRYEGVQVQAEAFGRAVRAGYHEGRERGALAVFHVRDALRGRDFGREERLRFLAGLGRRAPRLEAAPDLGVHRLSSFGDLRGLLDFAEGPSVDPARMREGVVMRSLDGAFAFKVIADRQLVETASKRPRHGAGLGPR